MARKPTEMMRSMLEDVYGAGKIDMISDLLADRFVQHDPMSGRLDRAGVERDVQMWRSVFPDMRMEVLDIIESGDKVIARWRATGTHKGELAGMPATGKKAITEGVSIVRFESGKAIEAWAQYDLLGMLRQLGLAPEMKAPRPRPDGGTARAR